MRLMGYRKTSLTATILLGLGAGACSGEVSSAGAGASEAAAPAVNPEAVSSATPGEQLTAPGAVPEAALMNGCTTGSLPPVADVPARLLSAVELNAALRQLLPNLQFEPIDMPLDGRVNTFLLNSRDDVNENHIRDFRLMAESIAGQASEQLGNVHSCEGQADAQACSEQFVLQLASQAYRRPLEPAETQKLTALHTAGVQAGGLGEGLRYALEAILQAPSFIYLHEAVGEGPYPLTQFEVAQRLANTLWRSIPDDALLADAANGLLSDPEVRAAHAQRLLEGDRGLSTRRALISQWLGLDQLNNYFIPPDSAPENLTQSMRDESSRLIDHVLLEQGAAWPELLRTPYTFLDETLAEHYQVDLTSAEPVGDGVWKAAIDGRAGLLTQANFLALAHGPVHRGLTIRKSILCGHVPGPVGVDVEAIPTLPDESERSKTEKRLAEAGCGACHSMMDPLGLPFEPFDDAGRFRSMDEHGNPVHGAGEILGTQSSDGVVSNATELVEKLAAAEETRSCMAQQLFLWSFARPAGSSDQCHIDSITQVLADSGDNVNAALLAIVREPSFAFGATGAASPATASEPSASTEDSMPRGGTP